jgi:glycosyltransferase involved in cell wall biosynthesis
VNWLRLQHLCDKYDFTVFASRFDNPRPDRIRWVRVPSLLHTAVLALTTYRLSAIAIFLWQRFVARRRFEIVQCSDGVLGHVDIVDAHFCNRHYLATARSEANFTRPGDVIGLLGRYLGSLNERLVHKNAPVPSAGLRRELVDAVGVDREKIVVMHPPVNTPIRPPTPREKNETRAAMGIPESAVVLLLVSAGDFKRKGLMPLIEAMADPRLADARLLVVGGTPSSEYGDRVQALLFGGRVSFCGRHDDIRPFFWAADAFVLPSRYEVFPAVTIEAAAGALPLLTTRLNGVEDYTVDGETGFTIEDCTPEAIASAVSKFISLTEASRSRMGCHAYEAVQCYRLDQFLKSWDDLYSQYGNGGQTNPV